MSEKVSEFFKVSGKFLPASIEALDEFPVFNYKLTRASYTVYTALKLYHGKKGIYLIAEKKEEEFRGDFNSANFTAPEGSLVFFYYTTASHSKVKHRYRKWFVVKSSEATELVLEDEEGDVNVRVRVKNLEPIKMLSKEKVVELDAIIRNQGWLPSEYDPVHTLYYYWLIQRVHESTTAVRAKPEPEAKPVTAVEPEEAPVEPEKLFERPEAVLIAPQATATPVERTAVLSEAPAPAPAEPAEQVQRTELVKVYLLSMRLPSKYLVQSVRVERGQGASSPVREIRMWEGEYARLAARLETLRRQCYHLASRIFAFVPDFGVWIAVSEEALEEARRIGEYVKSELGKLNISSDRYAVKAVPVFLEPGDAKSLLDAAIAHLSSDAEELAARIKRAEEERRRKELQRLRRELETVQRLLDTFIAFAREQLRRGEG